MDSHLDLELLAAQLRRHSEDLSLYSGFLLTILSAALPAELVRVRREDGWKVRLSRREPAVLGVSVSLGNRRYELDRAAAGEPVAARICHESGGVVMSSQAVNLDEWSGRLAADLAAVAGSNAAAVEALRRLTAP
jgi:hypothetical protein